MDASVQDQYTQGEREQESGHERQVTQTRRVTCAGASRSCSASAFSSTTSTG